MPPKLILSTVMVLLTLEVICSIDIQIKAFSKTQDENRERIKALIQHQNSIKPLSSYINFLRKQTDQNPQQKNMFL